MEKERRVKHPSDSCTEQVHIITQSDINGFDRLFGGALMSWIDILAAVVARRHSERNVTTVFVDTLEFRAPARVNDTVYMTGKMTYVGKTSMEVCVKTFVEELSGNRKLINVACQTGIIRTRFRAADFRLNRVSRLANTGWY